MATRKMLTTFFLVILTILISNASTMPTRFCLLRPTSTDTCFLNCPEGRKIENGCEVCKCAGSVCDNRRCSQGFHCKPQLVGGVIIWMRRHIAQCVKDDGNNYGCLDHRRCNNQTSCPPYYDCRSDGRCCTSPPTVRSRVITVKPTRANYDPTNKDNGYECLGQWRCNDQISCPSSYDCRPNGRCCLSTNRATTVQPTPENNDARINDRIFHYHCPVEHRCDDQTPCPSQYVCRDDGQCCTPPSTVTSRATTVQPKRVNKCMQPPEVGYCKALSYQYVYDNSTGKCNKMISGGCPLSENSFKTRKICVDQCIKPCMRPTTIGCLEGIPRYYYSRSQGGCRLYDRRGCSSDGSNNLSLEDCEMHCKAVDTTSVRVLPSKPSVTLRAFLARITSRVQSRSLRITTSRNDGRVPFAFNGK